MLPIYVKNNTNIDFDKEVDIKDPKCQVGDHVRISKYKEIFAKGYLPNGSEEVFVIKKIKKTVLWTYIISDLRNCQNILSKKKKKQIKKHLE